VLGRLKNDSEIAVAQKLIEKLDRCQSSVVIFRLPASLRTRQRNFNTAADDSAKALFE
jgi:hypothetical protein